MLELGLVDEAKATVEKWMARWIEVVSKVLSLKELLLKDTHLTLLTLSVVNLCRQHRNQSQSSLKGFSSLHNVLYMIMK